MFQWLSICTTPMSSGGPRGGAAVNTYEALVRPQELIASFSVPSDSQRGWNLVQVAATLRLVRFALGNAWYNVVLQHAEGDEKLDAGKRREFRRLAKAAPSEVHPLADTFWTGGPSELVRLIRFGGALRTLLFEAGDTNWKTKAEALASVDFAQAYFELKIASIYARNGFAVWFLPRLTGVQSPDLRLSKDGHTAVLECKKRVSHITAPLQRRIRGIIDRLFDARDQITASGHQGIACVEVEDDLPPGDLAAYTAAVRPVVSELLGVCCAMLTWEALTDAGDFVKVGNRFMAFPNPHEGCTFPLRTWCDPALLGQVAAKYPWDYGPAPPVGPDNVGNRST
jgi:hypothetical protein